MLSTPSDFLLEHKLELAVFEDELTEVRSILKKLNQDYVLNHTEEKENGIHFRNTQRYIFRVHCPTTNFAMAFLWLGVNMNPIYVSRRKKDKVINRKKWACPICGKLFDPQGKGGHLAGTHNVRGRNSRYKS